MYMYCIDMRGVLTSVLQESQRLITYDFVMLLLVMIPLHVLTSRLMVTMVANFCSLVILIHNTLLGEITISSTRTTRVNNIIPLFPSTYSYISTCQDSSSLILWLLRYASSRRRRRRRRRWKTWQKCEKHFLSYYTHFISQHN